MRNRAFYVCQRALILSLGIGSMLDVLCASALAQGAKVLDTSGLTNSKIVDTEVYSRVVEHEKRSRSPLTPTQVYPLSSKVSVGSSSSLKSGSSSAITSIEEQLALQLSNFPCQRAACLIESNSAIAPDTQPERTELEASLDHLENRHTRSEDTQSEDTQSEEILLGRALVGADFSVPTVRKLEENTLTLAPLSLLDSTGVAPAEAAALANSLANPLVTLDFPSDVIDQSRVAQANQTDSVSDQVLDDDLGTLRLQQTRSREDGELGILRLLQTAQAPPPPPKQPIAFIGGRLGFLDTNNAFRTETAVEDQIYQTGLTLYLFPRLSEQTNLYAIAETNLIRYDVDYNEIEVQAGIRHRLFRRTFAQVGWRNQRLYTPGFREKIVGVNFLDALISHRRILSEKVWLDGFYQLRLGFAEPAATSRFRQTLITSFNYAPTPKLRTGLVYQLEFVDYLQIDRFDTSQQFLGIISYNITPESKLSLFGGARFGSSSAAGVDLDDIFYGAGLNVNIPLF